jgi:hypothetical protein
MPSNPPDPPPLDYAADWSTEIDEDFFSVDFARSQWLLTSPGASRRYSAIHRLAAAGSP